MIPDNGTRSPQKNDRSTTGIYLKHSFSHDTVNAYFELLKMSFKKIHMNNHLIIHVALLHSCKPTLRTSKVSFYCSLGLCA